MDRAQVEFGVLPGSTFTNEIHRHSTRMGGEGCFASIHGIFLLLLSLETPLFIGSWLYRQFVKLGTGNIFRFPAAGPWMPRTARSLGVSMGFLGIIDPKLLWKSTCWFFLGNL